MSYFAYSLYVMMCVCRILINITYLLTYLHLFIQAQWYIPADSKRGKGMSSHATDFSIYEKVSSSVISALFMLLYH